jgi:hypothetical protein
VVQRAPPAAAIRHDEVVRLGSAPGIELEVGPILPRLRDESATSSLASTEAARFLAALKRIGWKSDWRVGSHVMLAREGRPEYTY